jgi:hypothetical protein
VPNGFASGGDGTNNIIPAATIGLSGCGHRAKPRHRRLSALTQLDLGSSQR